MRFFYSSLGDLGDFPPIYSLAKGTAKSNVPFIFEAKILEHYRWWLKNLASIPLGRGILFPWLELTGGTLLPRLRLTTYLSWSLRAFGWPETISYFTDPRFLEHPYTAPYWLCIIQFLMKIALRSIGLFCVKTLTKIILGLFLFYCWYGWLQRQGHTASIWYSIFSN